MKNLLLSLTACTLLYACSPAPKQEQTITPDSLFKNFQEEQLKLFPLLATSIGDARYNDVFPNDISQEYRSKVLGFYQGYKTQLASIDPNTLNENDRLSYDILNYECDINIEGDRFQDYLLPISQFYSTPMQVAVL